MRVRKPSCRHFSLVPASQSSFTGSLVCYRDVSMRHSFMSLTFVEKQKKFHQKSLTQLFSCFPREGILQQSLCMSVYSQFKNSKADSDKWELSILKLLMKRLLSWLKVCHCPEKSSLKAKISSAKIWSENAKLLLLNRHDFSSLICLSAYLCSVGPWVDSQQ